MTQGQEVQTGLCPTFQAVLGAEPVDVPKVLAGTGHGHRGTGEKDQAWTTSTTVCVCRVSSKLAEERWQW